MAHLYLAIALTVSAAIAAVVYFGFNTPYDPALLTLATLLGCTFVIAFMLSNRLERQQTRHRQLADTNALQQQLIEHSSSAFLMLDNQLNILFLNTNHPSLEKMVANVDVFSLDQYWQENVPEETRKLVNQAISDKREWRGELRFQNAEGSDYVAATIAPILEDNGDLSRVVISIEDISEHKAIADRLFIREHYNVLTGLPNRHFALRALQSTINEQNHGDSHFILIHIDLDRIRYINDSLGHQVVDRIFIETTERLRHSVSEDQVLAHLGADEFLIILNASNSSIEAQNLANTVLEQCRTPYFIDQHEVNISASLGLCQYPDDGADSTVLMRRAEAAMFNAKEMGGDRFSFYEEGMSSETEKRLEIENHLRYAIDRDEFKLYYQPVIDLKTNSLSGVEVLLRWQNTDLRNPGPDQFISVAEQSGLIIGIGKWVLEHACKQVVTWSQTDLPPLTVAVNISAKQFIDGDIVESVRFALRQSGLPASRLELEITEGLLINDTAEIRDTFMQLKKLGVHLSLDDFGTGYASLSYLKRYPFDTLKIDRSFVHDIDNCNDSVTLTNAIIAMGHSFNMTVIAEGVENLHQRRILRERHCDMVQGFLYSPPLPTDQFVSWAKRYAEMQTSQHV
ncbi:putative signaling protein [Zhongshania aliphaticivorans]|uniref:cyclic-guanylate-specific phosphodiesterase n=1 Tax=Zhongshania aliphaticivorans TaxID=1470434 RepID=A0A5S9PKN8_9GAMM|nr:bifunctional diguanylate cyclase/phosphodiesterase [Zhongshania aliphaticivorans]CAA0104504.1 putative signaling protein [Zhongshania aliphaticivorans]CAA0104762.1 putative signaling protein [Zhongshania aliphaticivorans]